MDKRKLSAIPRDEATADMLDIAGRLGSIRHIVTARIIEKNKILLLNFFEVSTLKKGKTEAAFRTFLSRDDYITQDLRQSKIKWLTSSFYNMDCFSIRESHWNPKRKEYDKEDKVFIRSNEEVEIIAKFFEKYKDDDRNEHYYWHWPEPWNSVRNFQDEVLERRLKERHAKELIAVDKAMEPFKKKPPQAFFDWCFETGMSFSRYLVYKEKKRGEAECYCTYCNKTGVVSRKNVRMRNNEKGICPFCGSKVTFKAKGVMAAQTRDERWFVYVHPTDVGFCMRYFSTARIIHFDKDMGKVRVEEYCHELSRAIFDFPVRKEPRYYDYEWGVYKQRGSSRWCPGRDKWMACHSIIYPGNLPEAWAHTPMNYSALEVLASNIPTEALDYEKAIYAYMNFPKLEWLCKMGLNKLASHVIDRKGGRYGGSVSHINYKAETIYEILGLTKVNTRVLQQIDGGDYELRLLQVAQKIGLQFKPDQLKEYYETFECNTDLLQATKRKVSLHKLVKYISKESERYPMGERGGRWQYSYMRYREREDPRIERKKNCAHDWLEYLRWCKELKYDLDNMFIYMPNNFKAVHDRTAKEYQELQDKKAAAEKRRREREAAKRLAQTKKAMEEIFSKNNGVDAFSIKGKGLILVVPKDGVEIKAEGEALHHCVGGYVERVAKGETNIFFIRKEESPDKPYFTMEWKDNRIIQCRGLRNCGMPPEVEAFVKIFEKKMLETIKKGDTNGKRKKQNLQSS